MCGVKTLVHTKFRNLRIHFRQQNLHVEMLLMVNEFVKQTFICRNRSRSRLCRFDAEIQESRRRH